MLFFTLKTIIISLTLIALIHYLYSFFKDTLTIPKVKDLVNKPAKRYDEMFNIINNMQGTSQHMQGTGQQGTSQHMQGTGQQGTSQYMQGTSQQGTSLQGTGDEDTDKHSQSMQDELKNFLSELKKPSLVKYKNDMIDTFPSSSSNELSYSSF
jgi:hypothetical protein